MHHTKRILLIVASIAGMLASQGCVLAAAGAAGAAGGYEAKKHGYGVQSPIRKDADGGYKGQNPVTREPVPHKAAPADTSP